MRTLFTLLCFSVFAASACKQNTAKIDEEGNSYYGEKITSVNPIKMDELLDLIATQDSVITQLEATVESVCQVKGCWMNLVDTAEDQEESIFVKFKDYGFFMPFDIAGQKVIVEGIAYREVTSVDELKHYAEDEGKSQEEIDLITEPVEELKFMANGVIIL